MAIDFDAVVVGSGAGGGVAAHALAARGWRVALLEKGRNPYPGLDGPVLRGSLLSNDELKRMRRNYGYHDPLIEPRTFRQTADGPFQTVEVQGLGVCVGGGTVHYDADSPRVRRDCLRRLSVYGPVEGAEVVDWPIAYEDLVPAYDLVERLLGVQGLAGADPFAEPRGPYPMPPGYPALSGLVLSAGAESLGYHPHPMPMAVNSVAYGGRPACANCGFCAMGCPINAKSSTAVTVIREALRGGNLTLLSECCALEILGEPSGERARGVRYLDARGAEQTLTARHVVVACNAIETPRLLLASTSSAHPDGLGNGSGLVGRCLMMHAVFLAVAVFDREIRSYRGRVITHAMADLTVDDGNPGRFKGGYVELGGSHHPVTEGIRYPWLVHKQLITTGPYRRRVATVTMIGEDVPVRDNRVELDPEVRDVYGRPVARITYVRHPHDVAMMAYFQPKLVEIAQAAGAREVMPMELASPTGQPDTKHLLGTARMGTDPQASVTDPFGRLHEVENVWIADGSVYPTSGAFNPTLTQQALALRSANHLADLEEG
jgi:choline dehydrogenase-like flavoprotein